MINAQRSRLNALALQRSRLNAPLLVLALSACSDCPDPFELAHQDTVRADQRLVITAPDGELRVMGRERSTLLEVEASGCRAGGEARIESGSANGSRTVRVVAREADVRVWVPAGAEVELRHGSGDVEVRAVGPSTLVTRGGDVRVAQVVGSVRVQAGAGTLYVREVVGDVEIIDGPGALFVEGVMGPARVRDGSGGIHLRDIEGDVVIDADGSGAIEARDLGGELVVRAKTDDVRMIRWNDVAGGVSLPDD